MDTEKLSRAVDEAVRANTPTLLEIVMKANKAGRPVGTTLAAINQDAANLSAEFQQALQNFATKVKQDIIEADRLGVGNWG